MNNFDSAFSDFIRQTHRAAEVVSDLIKGDTSFQNADYLFCERKAIVELKCLEEEKYTVIHGICRDLLKKGEIPPFRKGMTVAQILATHPEKDRIKLEMHSKVTSSLSGALEKANRQIRETRRHFELQSASGVVVIVNVDNTVLEPKLADGVISKLMFQKNLDGSFRFEELSLIIYISHVHSQENGAMPFYVVKRGASFEGSDLAFVEDFRDVWTRFTGRPVDSLQQAQWKDIREIEYISKQKNFE